ncbi:MAG: hypothetical protein HKN07_06630 [Acidimicrobiia bacterium]|nr:hypothetical protein [Acidimicrobiia bacterium]
MLSRSKGFFALALLVPLAATLVNTSRYIVQEGAVENGDQYVATEGAVVEGVVDGDLTIATSELFVSGTIDGDLEFVSSGPVTITGTVTGSIRGVTLGAVVIAGDVEGDVVVAAGSLDIQGAVSDDVLVLAGNVQHRGFIGRDLRGQTFETSVDGEVGRDVELSVQLLEISSSAQVGGDVIYRSDSTAQISAAADIVGQQAHLPARYSFFVRVAIGLATVLSFLAFLVSGIGLFWIFRRAAPRASAFVLLHPVRAVLAGLGFMLLLPVALAVLLSTLVGIPIALLGLVMFGLVFIFGPVPTFAAVGEKLLRGKGGLIGGFVVVAVLWRAVLWLFPPAGLAFYLGALVFGAGGWLIGGWELRNDRIEKDESVPVVVENDADDWEPPLPPPGARETETEVVEQDPIAVLGRDSTSSAETPSSETTNGG